MSYRGIALLCFLGSLITAVGEVKVPEPPDRAVDAVDFPGRDASLVWDAEGVLHVSYVQDTEEGARIAYRRVDREAPSIVSPSSLNIAAHGEMPPTVEVLPEGTVVITYVVKLPGGFRKTEIYLQRSTDEGRTWSDPLLLHDDGQVGGHAFLDTALNAQGEVIFSWIDPARDSKGWRPPGQRMA